MEDTTKILDKIKKLHQHAESAKLIGSEAEAEAFASMVSKLLNDHKLEMTDIQFEEQIKNEPVDRSYVDWKSHGLKHRKTRIAWIERLANMVAKAHGCRIVVITGSSVVIIVGTESNRQVAEYVLVTLVRSAEKIADKEYVRYFYKCRDKGATHLARGYREAFLLGFIDKIGARFEDERARAEASCTALVRFDKERAAVEDFMKNGMSTKKTSGLSTSSYINSAGYRDGTSKAGSMDLRGRAVNSGSKAKEIK